MIRIRYIISTIWMSDQQNSLTRRLTNSLKDEIKKFSRLGYGKYISLFTISLYFTIGLQLLKYVWPTILTFVSGLHLYVLTLPTINLMCTIPYNIFMYFVYTKKINFEQYRVNKNAPWPWEAEPKQWKKLFWKTIGITLLNVSIVGPITSYVDIIIFGFHIKMDVQSTPSIITMIWQIGVFLIIQQATFYFVHKGMHTPNFYWIHKGHHEYNVTTSLAIQYAHPVEHVLANLIPVGLGWSILSGICQVHIFTIIIWTTFRMFETLDGHCGYEWPWGQSQLIPFSAGSTYHYFHHKQNVGNYGSILHIFDTIFDTNKEFHKYEEKMTKKDK